MEDDVLVISNVKKVYHTKRDETLAIDNLSFNLKNGEFVSIVGPSGCGKSTLLSILSGLIGDYDGKISFINNSKIGYMLQDDCLFPFRTVLENCLLGLEITHTLNEENKNYVISLLKKYGLGDFINSYPDNLSGGMRQKTALIRTLATRPDILLLDEPFSSLDYQTRLKLTDDVFKIIKDEHKSAIMVTHNIEEAIVMSDRVIVLSKRPSSIKKIYNINFEEKSTPINNRKLKEYFNYYDLIWKDIDSSD